MSTPAYTEPTTVCTDCGAQSSQRCPFGATDCSACSVERDRTGIACDAHLYYGDPEVELCERTPTHRPHYHVHTTIPGYLCNCDAHYPLDARGRDAALREERDWWRDYAADAPADDPVRIEGSVKSGRFDITAGIAFWRVVEAWLCSDPDCYAED